MITKITNIEKYKSLFERAWRELQLRGSFTDDELLHYKDVNTFTCLEEYFTKLGSLMNPTASSYGSTYNFVNDEGEIEQADNPKNGITIVPDYEFVMLPLDEEHLEINADTRDITIPTRFKKFVGVQGDHFAETLIFSIDRFFDYVDLLPGANENMHIYIQWIDADGQHRATPVSMIHYDANTQKILFGWQLDSEVTKAAKTINFSVRFLAKKDRDILTSFSTKTHSITIVPALYVDLEDDVIIEDTSEYFLKAIKDSSNTSAPPADTPRFYKDLKSSVEINGNSHEFMVQAISGDSGYIDYQGWYKDGVAVTDNVEIRYMATNPTSRVDCVTYYTYNTTKEMYEVYAGDIPNTSATPPIIYEKFYIYTIPEGTDPIVGEYYATVRNRTGTNISKTVESTKCKIEGPSPLIFTADLANGKILESDETLNILQPEIDDLDDGKTQLTYQWRRSTASGKEEDQIAIPAATSEEYTPSEPGWYSLVVTGTRNRATTSVTSNICKVTNLPVQPSFKRNLELGGQYIVLSGSSKELTVEIQTLDALQTDSITYTWYACVEDGDPVIVTSSNAELGVASIEIAADNLSSTLTAVKPADEKTHSFYCIVTNTLNGEEATSESNANIIAS